MTTEPISRQDIAKAKSSIMRMLTGSDATRWQETDGRAEIATPHVPIGWLSIDTASVAALDELVAEHQVTIVDLPHRARAGKTVQFVAMVSNER